ncbi:HlyD family efflux transporter periplasmic adaptor subunit [Marinobacteraceae bacterium S3BR75-40.1]
MSSKFQGLGKHRKLLVPVAAVAITAFLILVLWWSKPVPPKTENQEKSWPVQTVSLEKKAYAPEIRLLGQVDTPLNATLTAPVAAEVEALPFLEGDNVKQGQSVVQLDTRDAQLIVTQREADVAELKAQLAQERNRAARSRDDLARQKELADLAEAAVEREKRLQKSDLSSQARLDEARRNLASARLALNAQQLEVENADARLAALEAKQSRASALLEQARLDLERAQMPAPFDGQITRIHVSPGERVRTGEQIAALYATKALEVRAQIPQRWVPTARTALADQHALDARARINGETYPLQLKRLSGAVNNRAGGVDGLFSIRAEDVALPLGETLDVTLSLPPIENTYSLPISALYGTDRIYRVADGRLEGLQVTVVGDRYTPEGQHILIRSPKLKDGDTVVTTQLPNAVNGLKVDLRNAAEGEPAS